MQDPMKCVYSIMIKAYFVFVEESLQENIENNEKKNVRQSYKQGRPG